ncbi:MAG: NAD(P)H-hydrate dehydratase [Sphingomonadaceae bacterium]|nr:NAD(P)H-hydrate dehydratase [Sphingomonadaceae bacterium]
MTPIDPALLRTLPLPDHDSGESKAARGAILAVGGSLGVPGAILLTAVAALRAGAGKLQIATCASMGPQLGLLVPEALVVRLTETPAGGIDPAAAGLDERLAAADAVVVGPGMDADAPALVAAVLAHRARPPLVIDAGGLRDLGAEGVRARGGCVLTPDGDEAERLTGAAREAVLDEPERVARDAAARFGAVVALKGGSTVVAAPDGRTFRYAGGGVGLATSGSGDTLAGIVGGLLARGAEPLTATLWGVWLHGEAGRRLAARHGRLGFLARELLAEVPRAMHEVSAGGG